MTRRSWQWPDTRSGSFVELAAVNLWIHVPGRVVSKANHRHTTTTSHSASWASIRAYENEISTELRRARPTNWPRPPHTLPPPAHRTQFVAVIAAATAMDVGNISKSVFDAAEQILYTNDKQVVATSELVHRTVTPPGTLISFAYVPIGIEPEDVLIDLLSFTVALLAPPPGQSTPARTAAAGP